MTTPTPDLATTTERTSATLHAIKPNPYQTRLSEDAAHVAALAEDLLANGLLQVPLARPHPSGFGLELAFGHTRLAAYKLLFEQGHAEYELMPLDVRPLTDRQMSDMAASENARRKNLTAIETATALQTRIAAFKISQSEAGQPFGLGQPAVANLLRLLKLPAELHADIETGALPERTARALVTAAGYAERDVIKLGKEIAAASPADRDETLDTGLSEILEKHGRELREATFAPDMTLDLMAGDGLPVRACRGCQDLYRSKYDEYCMRPACFDAKQPHGKRAALDAASAKTGIALAADGDTTSPVSVSWDRAKDLAGLIKANKTNPDLGLRLVWIEGNLRHRYNYHEQHTGHDLVGIETVNPNAVKAWTQAKAQGTNGTGKTVTVKPAANDGKGLPISKADLEKQRAVEAAAKESERLAQEERRRERGAALKEEADVVWLIKNFAEIAGPQLAISGPVLVYATERWIGRGMGRGRAGNFNGLLDWYDDLKTKCEEAGSGKEADSLRRRLVAAAEVFEHCLGGFGDRANFGRIVDDLTDLAQCDDGYEEKCLGVKLPVGWNKPPIHHTEGNCWHCGTFASNRGKLTQGELAAGWVAEFKGEQVLDVRCPDCKGKPAPKPAVAKKGGKK